MLGEKRCSGIVYEKKMKQSRKATIMLVHMGRIIRLGGKMKDEGTLTTYEERRANAMNNNHQGSKKHDRKNWKPFKLWPENY